VWGSMCDAMVVHNVRGQSRHKEVSLSPNERRLAKMLDRESEYDYEQATNCWGWSTQVCTQ